MTRDTWLAMVAHAFDGLPDEACGLLAGPPGPDGFSAEGSEEVVAFYPTGNAAASAKLYTVEPRDHLRAERDADDRGLVVNGVMHSHTHTDPYPSPTDVAQAPDPAWHFVIVSLRDEQPMLRSYRIVDGGIAEEPVLIEG